MLIVQNRRINIYENLIFSISITLFNLSAFINSIFFSKFLYKNGAFSGFYSYGTIEEDIFAIFDIFPQISGCIISLILNGIILIKIRHEKKQAASMIKGGTNETTLTINILFHTIMPLFLVIYANVYYHLAFQYNIQSKVAEKIFVLLDLSYSIVCPLSLILFIGIYRSYFKKIFCFNKITLTKVSMTKNIMV
ncbi:Hypothetical protein SRAE_0000028000 [Strongyloides ratti]|uniref:7TM GPCR, serpentine receptor class v (Srv) family-containing protein n=1 Tax=Strongyloides ratti TaxID=34506 RepID=A0A090KZ51_STRRB|nr:Hypothetical protein SRAE_0000028000 [Strongyloides ratti]CEF61152.1 Hypothetical protein SRAE_0000028000 [Strongyloides ratti]